MGLQRFQVHSEQRWQHGVLGRALPHQWCSDARHEGVDGQHYRDQPGPQGPRSGELLLLVYRNPWVSLSRVGVVSFTNLVDNDARFNVLRLI